VPDIAIRASATASVPRDYLIPGAQEILPKLVSASMDGTSATAPWYPCLQVVSPGGNVMGTALPKTSVAAGASADVSWFPHLEDCACAITEPVGVTTEVVYYDTPNAGTPLTMSTTLTTGVSYVLVAEGTYSLWNDTLGTGTPEANAMFPGSTAGRASTQVGLDADTCFAKKTGSAVTIGHSSVVSFSLNGGSSYSHVEPVGGPYVTPQVGHLYRYELTGQGSPLKIKLTDINPPDNYGKLRFTLQIPNGTGTGSGAGSLVPPADTTNNGQVLAVLAGLPTWTNADGGSA